jgi:carbonic anhydrase/acetyltransferase-like protein (isoleucine patch superfamily)
MILTYKDKKPVMGQNVFVAPTAMIIGDVEVQDGASIWYGVVIGQLHHSRGLWFTGNYW